MKKIWLIILLMFLLTACKDDIGAADGWQRYLDSAEGSKVNLVIPDAEESIITYFEKEIAPSLKETYDVELVVKTMPKEQVIATLKQEKTDEVTVGSMDLIWLNEEMYATLNSDALLYMDYLSDLKDYNKYIDAKSLDATYVGRIENKGDAVPLNATQLTYYYNGDMIYDPPSDINMLNQLLEEKPEMFTYPHPKDSVGNTFVRNVILNFTEPDAFVGERLTEEQFYQKIKPGLDYLKKIKSSLYKKGESYPDSALALSDLFASEKVLVTMSFDFQEGQQKSGDGLYPYGTSPFNFTDKNAAQLDYIGIAFNATNKSGAMVVINYLLSEDVQLAKIKDENFTGLPPYTFDILPSTMVKSLRKVNSKKTVIDADILVEARVHDIPKEYHDMITKLWAREILGE